MKNDQINSRRNFMGALALGATASSLSMLTNTIQAANNMANVKSSVSMSDVDEWFKKVKGDHRVVYDGSMPHKGMPVLWTFAFYLTNNAVGVTDDNMTGVCVLRHNAIPFALEDSLWVKYELGNVFDIKDNATGKGSHRNPYYEPKDGDFPIPGVQGIKELQARGAMFCVCDLALNVYSGFTAEKLGMDKTVVYEDWKSGVLPDIQIVPSGVLALERAQKNGCGYIFAGE